MIKVKRRSEKITIVRANQTTIYVNNDRLIEGQEITLQSLLINLGFEVQSIHIACHDMPKIHGDHTLYGDYSSYKNLSDLLADKSRFEKEERKKRIQSIYSELTRLEKEDKEGRE